MPSNFPTTLDTLTNPAAGDQLSNATTPHAAQHTNVNDILEALEAKLGLGASTPGAVAAVLRRTGSGASAWGTLVNADVDAAAAIAYSKLALAGSIVSADLVDGTVATADLAAGAVTQVGISLGTTVSPTTTSTTFVTLQGNGSSSELRVDLTTQASGVVLCFLAVSNDNSAAGNANRFGVAVDGGTEQGVGRNTPFAANYVTTTISIALFTGLTAATHAFRGRWTTTSGTMTALNVERYLIAMELKR